MEKEYETLQIELAEIKKELKKLSSELLELMVLNRFIHEERNKNSIKLEAVENQIVAFKGAMSLIKWVISVFGVSVLGFFVYLVSSDIENKQKITVQETQLQRTEQEIIRLNSQLEKVENTHDKNKF